MPEFVVIVNGVPGAGKTTLAAPLAEALGLPLVGKDAIMEALFDSVRGRIPRRALGVLASETQWAMAAAMTEAVVLESFFAAGRDEPHVQRGLRNAGDPHGVEVWCEIPLETAFERYCNRPRHDAHADAERHDEWWTLARRARPITGLPVIPVAPDGQVDVVALSDRIAALRVAVDQHEPRTPTAATIDRRAARVVLLNDNDQVLLIESTDRTDPARGSWWLTPGGGIEAGESAVDAAVREVQEETGFIVEHAELGDPVWDRVAIFDFEGESFRQHESWFIARVLSRVARSPSPTQQERGSTVTLRWWTIDELISTAAVIHPPDLGMRLRMLLHARP